MRETQQNKPVKSDGNQNLARQEVQQERKQINTQKRHSNSPSERSKKTKTAKEKKPKTRTETAACISASYPTAPADGNPSHAPYVQLLEAATQTFSGTLTDVEGKNRSRNKQNRNAVAGAVITEAEKTKLARKQTKTNKNL
jgi:hypothetical protein